MQFKPSITFILVIGAWFMLTNYRDPNNPPVSRTGAPSETTCGASGCHSGGNYTGTVTLSGIPDTVIPSQTYTVTLTNTSNAVRSGFELTCLDNGNAYSGTLTNGTGTSIGTNASLGRKYIRQSTPKNLSNGSVSWTFTWKAPASASGNLCKFYFVSLCANGNGNNSGDKVLTGTKNVVMKTTSATHEAPEAAKAWLDFNAPLGAKVLNVNLLNAEKGQMYVYDLQGRRAMQVALSAQNQISTLDLPAGIYLAQVAIEGHATTIKFYQN